MDNSWNLFVDQNYSLDECMDSMDDNQSVGNNDSCEPFDSGFINDYTTDRLTTTIEKSLDVLDVSPIRKKPNADQSYGSLYDFDDDRDLSFDKSKSSRKYFPLKRTLPFSPTYGSTPKQPKTKTVRTRTPVKRKKSYKNRNSDISLWDKAINKNPELKQWINSFNGEMEKIESSQLSIIKQ